MLFRDFEAITGVNPSGNYTSLKRDFHLRPGTDWNGWGWREDKEKFKKEYGFDFGDDDCMKYLYPCGIARALRIFAEENGGTKQDAYNVIAGGLKALSPEPLKIQETKKAVLAGNTEEDAPIQISIIVNGETLFEERRKKA